MSKDYTSMNLDELKAELNVQKEALAEAEDEREMLLGQEGQHISNTVGIAARLDQETSDAEAAIKEIEELIAQKQ